MRKMRRNQPKDSRFEEYDEHNQPTEPMSQVILTPYSSSSNIYGAPTNPLPEPDEQLFLPGSNAFLVPGSSNRSKVSPAYPFLPAAPAFNGNGRPPGEPIRCGRQTLCSLEKEGVLNRDVAS